MFTAHKIINIYNGLFDQYRFKINNMRGIHC